MIVFIWVQGVIRDDRDLDVLGPEFRDAYTKRPDDSALNDSRVATKWSTVSDLSASRLTSCK